MSKIEWTEKTWNPVTGCNKVSQGCKNCYAETMHRRLMAMFPKKYSKPFLQGIEVHHDELTYPISIKKPTTFFVNSMSDLFHKDVPFSFIASVFAVMEQCQHHTFQIVTKRPEIALKFCNTFPEGLPLPNVWIGVSCEDQETADERIPYLLRIPAAIRFLSCEPLLGYIDLDKGDWLPKMLSVDNDPKINWVITGGESGRKARPMHPDWVRALRDDCKAHKVPFFFKQWGNWLPLECGPAPMRFFSNDGVWIDGNEIDLIDPESGEAGKYEGRKFMDPMESVVFCIEEVESDCSFLAQGNKPKFDNKIDGHYHLEMPTTK